MFYIFLQEVVYDNMRRVRNRPADTLRSVKANLDFIDLVSRAGYQAISEYSGKNAEYPFVT